MAVVHVSTWSDFKTAVGGTDNQVIVDNDIVCDETLSDSTTWRCESINGQGHAIYNIQSTCARAEFSAGRVITISNLGFLNFALYGDSNSGMFVSTDYGSRWFDFNDCQFQGMSLKSVLDDGCGCTRCSISLSSCRSLAPSAYQRPISFHECWIDLGTVNCKSNDYVIIFGDLRNTYVKGTINLTSQTGEFNIIRGDVTNCILNTYIKCDTSRVINLKYHNEGISRVSLFNTDRIQTASTSDLRYSGWTGLSDSDLKSATAVQATGFPIVV